MGAVRDVVVLGRRSLRDVLFTGSAPPLPRMTWWRGLPRTLVMLACGVAAFWIAMPFYLLGLPQYLSGLAVVCAALTTASVLAALRWPDRLGSAWYVAGAVPVVLATFREINRAVYVGSTVPAWFTAALTGAALLLVARDALAAWRLIAVVALLGPLYTDSGGELIRGWGWPWPRAFVLAAVVVAVAVAVRCAPREQITAWALSCLPLFVHSQFYDALLGATLLGAVMIAANTVRLRRTVREQSRLTAEERTRSAVLEERGRIARELHDVVAHHMSVLAVRADSAPYRYPGLPDEVRAEFADLNATAREGLTEMRRLLGVLRGGDDEETAPQPGIDQIHELVDRVRAAGAEIRLSLTPAPVPAGIALSAYRIVQEALSNATRHAPGAAVRVVVAHDEQDLVVQVDNDRGTGSAAEPPSDRSRHGLLGMRERIGLLGGRLDAGPTSDGGYTVAATIPLEEPR